MTSEHKRRLEKLRFGLAALLIANLVASEPAFSDAVTTGASQMAYVISQKSPLLSKAEKTAISQDFNGAPLSGKPRVHQVIARAVSCRTHQSPNPGAVLCSVDFGSGQPAILPDAESRMLFGAMGKGLSGRAVKNDERKLVNLACVVDDDKAQKIPATGDDIPGFSCKFDAQ